MSTHLLDPHGITTVPEGYKKVDTEVGFIKAATRQHPLLVCGESLCKWAEAFFRGRGLAFRYVRPMVDELRDVCPELTMAQARRVIELLGPDDAETLRPPFSLNEVLERLYPMNMWRGVPSSQHVADWLIWIYETDPDDNMWPLLGRVGRRWHEGFNQPESEFYCITSRGEAERAIEMWLTDDGSTPFSTTFPADVPAKIQERVLSRWQSEIVQTQGRYLASLLKQDAPRALKEQAANYTAQYFESNPSIVTQKKLQELSPYLGRSAFNKLRDILPPDEPTLPPHRPEEVLSWFRNSYFPYREWQNGQSDVDGASSTVLEAARQFALWYLQAYPAALLGDALLPFLAMNKMVQASKETDVVTLIVVLDGLHHGDARDLAQKIGKIAPRLTLTADELAFSSLPTITRFCKPSLFNGTPPRLVDDTSPVGRIISDRQDPVTLLSEAARGDLFLWRVGEPDKTYHSRNSSDMLHEEVLGTLDTVAQNIGNIVEKVPHDVLLQIVVTTDHGRLLGKSERLMSVPRKMESHGRTAWGRSEVAFGETNHVIEGNVVYLSGFDYGLQDDLAIILDEAAFLTNDQRGGAELYPHGGLFPEEVVVPWLGYARDVKPPKLDITITGTGTARQKGELDVHVVNLDLRSVKIQHVTLQLARGVQIIETNLDLAPQSNNQYSFDFEPWFSAEEVEKVKATVVVQLSNGLDFDIEAQVALEAEDMYRRDNILEDLI